MEYGLNLFSPKCEYLVTPGGNVNSDTALYVKTGHNTALVLFPDSKVTGATTPTKKG